MQAVFLDTTSAEPPKDGAARTPTDPSEEMYDALGECFDAVSLLAVIGEALDNICGAFALAAETKERIEQVRGCVATAEHMIDRAALRIDAARTALVPEGRLQ